VADREIVVDILPDGSVQIDAKNFEGGECKKLTAALEEDLGTVTHTRTKPEFHRTRAQVRV